MAERRMFTKKIVDSDAFISLPATAQALYLHLCMNADDDGFCNQIAISIFKSHASDADLQVLIDKRFILEFDSGVICIKHWLMANTIQKDRYKPTAYKQEYAKLSQKENHSYTFCIQNDSKMETECVQVDSNMETQISIDKDNIDKDSIDKDNIGRNIPPSLEEVIKYCQEKNSNIDPYSFYYHYSSKNWMIGKNKMKNWHMAVSTWERRTPNKNNNNNNLNGFYDMAKQWAEGE